MRRRMHDDRGATLVILAISSLALIAVAGLALDGGRLYGERREMQNAADAASMAGTRQLDQLITGKTSDASTILTAVQNTATKNGADLATVTCTLVRFDRSVIEPCPTTAAISPATLAVAAGVRVTTAATQDTFFMKAIGTTSFTANADATAQIGQPGGSYVAPFLVCATAPGHVPPILVPDAASPTGFVVNDGTKGFGPTAIGAEYSIYGNDIKNDGRDCGNPSSSFRGNVNTSDPYSIPGEWDTDTGNANGPTLRLVNSGNVCSTDFVDGCVVVLPLCPRSNGKTGTNYRAYCVELGLFEISHVANHDIDAIFRGSTTINSGGIIGPADPNGARIVALTD